MPAKAKELSALAVARLKETGRYAVGGVDGLHLNVEGNSRVWILRIVVGKRFNKNGVLTSHRRDIGLGSYPEVSLAEARAKARELREMVRKGIDPIAHKREQIQLMYLQKLKEKTFRQCAEVVISNKTKNLRNEKHIAQWSSSLETYVYPALGERAIASITKIDIASVLEPIWSTKHDTASRIRGRLETIFDYAKAMEYIVGDNPAMWKGNLEPILGTIKKDPKPHSSLPYDQIQSFMRGGSGNLNNTYK